MDITGKWKIGMGSRFCAIWEFAPDGLVHNLSFGGAGRWGTTTEGVEVSFPGGKTLRLREEAGCLVLIKQESSGVRAILSRWTPARPDSKHLTILFAHHSNDELTRWHFELLQKYNREANIVPVAFPGQSSVLEQSWQFDAFFPGSKWEGDSSQARGSADLLALNYVLSPVAERTQKICIFEYDTLCNIALSDYFREVWGFSLVARDLMFPGKGAWSRFPSIPLDFAQYAMGVRPLAPLLINYDALFRMAVFARQHPETWGMHSEVRIGTLFNLLTMDEMTVIPQPFRSNIDSQPIRFDITQPGLFHPVKRVVKF